MSAVARPDWWSYPLECAAGHPWGPGRVTVGWMPCDCPNARANRVLGHLWVRCRAEGCSSIWYRPRHERGRLDLACSCPEPVPLAGRGDKVRCLWRRGGGQVEDG